MDGIELVFLGLVGMLAKSVSGLNLDDPGPRSRMSIFSRIARIQSRVSAPPQQRRWSSRFAPRGIPRGAGRDAGCGFEAAEGSISALLPSWLETLSVEIACAKPGLLVLLGVGSGRAASRSRTGAFVGVPRRTLINVARALAGSLPPQDRYPPRSVSRGVQRRAEARRRTRAVLLDRWLMTRIARPFPLSLTPLRPTCPFGPIHRDLIEPDG